MRRLLIFDIDTLSLAPCNRNLVFTQMKEFATNVMRPGDEAMIATFNRSMKIRASFTRDPKQIAQTLDAIAGGAEVVAAGGHVTTVAFHAGFSTTALVERMAAGEDSNA